MKVRFTLGARADLQEIGEYISKRNPRAASRMIASVHQSVMLVGRFPRRGRKQKAKGVRNVGAGKYPYNIYYRIDEAEQVIAILQIRRATRRQRYENS